MSLNFLAAATRVSNRGVPPASFLTELVEWGRTAEGCIFAINAEPHDVYGVIRNELGPWEGDPGGADWTRQRKAAMLELLRVLAGFESSWRWREGVDTTNATSMAHIEGRETGLFQVSFDSIHLEKSGDTLKECIRKYCGSLDAQRFIDAMKEDHHFALEYAVRLLRISYRWDGPILRHELHPFLSRSAMREFAGMLG